MAMAMAMVSIVAANSVAAPAMIVAVVVAQVAQVVLFAGGFGGRGGALDKETEGGSAMQPLLACARQQWHLLPIPCR